MLKECWYALTLAILAPRPLFPEEAFIGVSDGKIPRRQAEVVARDMIAIHKLGEDSWTKIGEMFGMKQRDAMCMASRWKRKQRMLQGRLTNT